jgi:hypothetical protein
MSITETYGVLLYLCSTMLTPGPKAAVTLPEYLHLETGGGGEVGQGPESADVHQAPGHEPRRPIRDQESDLQYAGQEKAKGDRGGWKHHFSLTVNGERSS